MTASRPPRATRTRAGRGALAVALLAATCALVALAPRAGAERPAAEVAAVRAIGITVSDLDRAVDFYGRVLGFTEESRRDLAGEPWERLRAIDGIRLRVARLRLGAERLELTEVVAPRGRPLPADSRSNDRWFQHVAIIVSDMDRAYARLRDNGVEHASPAPQRLPDWNPNAGGIRAFYFKDPDGHVLEVLELPPGKGEPRWQESSPLFLGIDHTAVVVADSDASLRFYRDLLGMHVAGTSENWGPEQERLNAVPGAHLRITTLRAPRGPGIEMLEYLSPRDGRATPADVRANDLVHWQTHLAAADLPAAESALRAADVRFVSPGAVALDAAEASNGTALLIRDPDGHALELSEQRENER